MKSSLKFYVDFMFELKGSQWRRSISRSDLRVLPRGPRRTVTAEICCWMRDSVFVGIVECCN